VDKAKISPIDFFEKTLSKSDFVRQLQPEDAKNLAMSAEYIDLPANTLVFSEGDKADNMYFIVTGLVQVFIGKGQGKPEELARLAEGDYFGEQGFMEMNKDARTASIQTLEPTRLLNISGKTFKKLVEKSSELETHLESIGKDQLEVRKKHRKLQLLNRLVQSRSSVSLSLPRASGNFTSLCLAVNPEDNSLHLDEVVSEYRNPVLVGDTLSVTGSLNGTPLKFKTKVKEINKLDRRPLYVCSLPEVLVYEQQRDQFRLVLGLASRAEASMTINDKKLRGTIIDISEGGVCFRLPAGSPIDRGHVIEGVKLGLDTTTSFNQDIEILNIHPVVHTPTLIQIGARFKTISPEDVILLRDHIKEAERRRLRNVKNSQDD
jgi:CRP-like cAMP-binding protein